MLDALAARFPTSERAAQAAYWVGVAEPNDSARIEAYERVRTQYPPDHFRWSASAMELLFDAYVRERSPKSVSLAEDMLRLRTESLYRREWGGRLAYARTLALAWSLMDDRHDAAASGVLDGLEPPSAQSPTGEALALWRAMATANAGDTRRAYRALIVRAARTPSDGLLAAFERYRAALGLTATQVDSALWAVRDSAAVAAGAFNLIDYASGDSVSLSAYRGRPVLLTFWYPGCGPCRAEFPRIEAVVDSFAHQGLAYVAINVVPSQDAYVMPFIHGHHYSFTALRGSDEMAWDAYQVRGEPANFLIDRNGRIVYRDFFVRDRDQQRTLELMVSSMLQHEWRVTDPQPPALDAR